MNRVLKTVVIAIMNLVLFVGIRFIFKLDGLSFGIGWLSSAICILINFKLCEMMEY